MAAPEAQFRRCASSRARCGVRYVRLARRGFARLELELRAPPSCAGKQEVRDRRCRGRSGRARATGGGRASRAEARRRRRRRRRRAGQAGRPPAGRALPPAPGGCRERRRGPLRSRLFGANRALPGDPRLSDAAATSGRRVVCAWGKFSAGPRNCPQRRSVFGRFY